jgi:hypothetical protein
MVVARVVACLAVSALAGCYSTSIAQTPSTVPPGKARFGVGLEVDGAAVSNNGGLSPELSLRVGVLDRLDVGVKTTLQSVEAQVKAQLLRGDFDLSLALSGATSRDEDDDKLIEESAPNYEWMRSTRLMLIAGQRIADSTDLVLMGDGQFGLRSATYDGRFETHFAGVGGGVGVLFKGVFLPEVVVTHFIAGEHPMFDALQAGDTRIQFTVTALLGGEEKEKAQPP